MKVYGNTNWRLKAKKFMVTQIEVWRLKEKNFLVTEGKKLKFYRRATSERKKSFQWKKVSSILVARIFGKNRVNLGPTGKNFSLRYPIQNSAINFMRKIFSSFEVEFWNKDGSGSRRDELPLGRGRAGYPWVGEGWVTRGSGG